MCLCIPESEKKQPAQGLPPTWTFLFKENRRYANKNKNKACTPGLYIYNPKHPKVCFRSVEAAVNQWQKEVMSFNPNAVADFNGHIGVTLQSATMASTSLPPTAPSSGKKPANIGGKSLVSAMTLEELYRSRCGECVNCKKHDCGQCSSCLSNCSSRHQRVCLQKVSSNNVDICNALSYARQNLNHIHETSCVLLDVLPCVGGTQSSADAVLSHVSCGMEVYSRSKTRGIRN